MPTYDFRCIKCGEAFTMTLTIKERGATPVKCTKCGASEVEQLPATFFAKTSRKS